MKTNILSIGLFLCFISMNAQSWQFAMAFGGANANSGKSVSVDASGNVYTAGFFGSTLTMGTTTHTTAGLNDFYVLKQDNAGNILWSLSAGGSENDIITSASCSPAGDLYVGGSIESSSINLGGTILTNNNPGPNSSDAFLAKIDPSGNVLWSKMIYGDTIDIISSVSADHAGNVIVSGWFYSDSLFIDGSVLLALDNDYFSYCMFIAKFDAVGNLIFAKTNQIGYAAESFVSVDAQDNIYLAGDYADTLFGFDNLFVTNISNFGWTSDLYIAKFTPSGTGIWIKKFGGGDYDFLKGIAVDNSGNAFVTGGYYSGSNDTIYFDGIKLTNGSTGGNDYYVAGYDSNGNVLWANKMDYGLGEGSSITVDNAGNPVISGYFYGTNAVFGNDTLLNTDTNIEAFIVKYDINGVALFAASVNGIGGEYIEGIAADSYNNIFVTGNFDNQAINFDSIQINVPQGNYIFNAKYGSQNPGSCAASFYIYPDSSQSHQYFAVNNSYGTGSLTYYWSWGDGSFDTIAYPQHIYADTGYYTICVTITDSLACSSTFCDSSFYFSRLTNPMVYLEVIPNVPTGIETVHTSEIKLFPNPAGSIFTISFDNIQGHRLVDIISLTGQTLASYPTSASTLKIDQQLASGLYFIRITEKDKKTKYLRLVIQ